MMSLSLFFVAVVLTITISNSNGATNYCTIGSCAAGTHIACNNNGALGVNCTADAKMITIGPLIQAAIVKRHNVLRNKIASGSMTKFKIAVRMATMQWDAELANIAAFNVKQCLMKHDVCRNTAKFSNSGQNLGWYAYSGPTETAQAISIKLVNAWFAENVDADMTHINSYTLPTNNKVIGHFTQVVQEKANYVGCAILQQTKNNMKELYLACNYAYPNFLSSPVYTKGAKAGAKCTTGVNVSFKSLCSVKEKYTY